MTCCLRNIHTFMLSQRKRVVHTYGIPNGRYIRELDQRRRVQEVY